MTTGEQSTPTQAIIEEQLRTAFCEPLCDFFAFPAQYQRHVLTGLWVAAAVIPTANETLNARHRGGQAQLNVEKRYKDAADAFARAINPNFDPQAIHTDLSDLETARWRGEFYRMVRYLSSEMIQTGAGILGQLEPSLPRPVA